jgi:hypothetical protein
MPCLRFHPVQLSMLVGCSLSLICAVSCATHPKAPVPAQPPTGEVLEVAPGVSIRYMQPWAEAGYKYANAKELALGPRSSEGRRSRIVITTERRLSLADADRRLLDVAHSRAGKANFYAIGGWPAVELRFREPLPLPVDHDEQQNEGTRPLVDRAVLAVAADTTVLDFDIWVASGTGTQVVDEAIRIARSASFQTRGNADETRRRLQQLSHSSVGVAPTRQPVGAGQSGGSVPGRSTPAAPVSNIVGTGELEIAASTNGQQIAVAAAGGLTFSADGGASFASPNIFPNDPTVTRGASAAFYLGSISRAQSPPVCNDTVSRSTNGGASFSGVGSSAQGTPIGQVTFPDQPHIAADSFRLSTKDKDQIYAVWRNESPVCVANCPEDCFTLSKEGGSFTSMIACSQDNGANWTLPPLALPGGGDHPRVAVGFDGSVYTVALDGSSVLLTRFSSCANGLAPQTGYPVTVASDASVACPLPGIDRCDTPLTSQMVAPDPWTLSTCLSLTPVHSATAKWSSAESRMIRV